ncbi:hypothetical protein EW145_g415 [Phellinidium pouzarii]|uniref:RNB domain-containing protein n=1 Tax=Phellinidium pouzarii TaxID=167371 RepID=A0A4S4LK91_9AGAM|nr:hypothetical protein EW145_g415 [Phellinidium pouzarii]
MANKLTRRTEIQSVRNIFAGHPLENWTGEDLIKSNTTGVEPGSFVELRRNNTVTYAVVLQNIENIGYNTDTQSISINGDVIIHRSTDVMFAVPNFADAFLVKRCGFELMHTTPHELAARLKILKLARDFERALESESSRLGRLMRDVHPQVCSLDEWGHVTTMQIARMLEDTPNIPIVTLFAVHKQLMSHSDEFVAHPVKHRFLHTFSVRPLSHLKSLSTVQEWVRQKSPIIHKFQDKAKQLIDQSRKLAVDSIGERPSRADIALSILFSSKEQELINLLKLSLFEGRKTQSSNFENIAPTIIKGTDRYDEAVTSSVTLRFLQEIGVYTPWEDMACKKRELNLPADVEDPALAPNMITTTGSTALSDISGLVSVDPHESVRHDFGDLPVYVIDDVGAHELDDGISFEPIEGESGSVWLHVHIADPTAVLPFGHPLVQQIMEGADSMYFEHRSWPMLPKTITKLCDMNRSTVGTSGQNVLTFSAKINTDGSISDHKVRAGRVRNVHNLRYDDVNEVIGISVLQHKHMPFESLSTLSPQNISDTLPHADMLKLAYDVTRRLVRKRLESDNFSYSAETACVDFVDKPVVHNPSHSTRPIFYGGFPKLQYIVTNYRYTETGSRSLVAECMKVAGRVCSLFCAEHNIPVIRRALPPLKYYSVSQRERIRSIRDEIGYVDPAALVREGLRFPASEFTVSPAAHDGVGARDGEGYVRATSPLRRAEDMLAHWQVKSALLPGGGARPPLDEDMLRRTIRDISNKKHAMKVAYRMHARQWTHTYIRHFIDAQKRERVPAWSVSSANLNSDVLCGLDAYVTQSATYNPVRWALYQDIFIPKLGLSAVMKPKDNVGLELASPIKVNVKGIIDSDLNPYLEVELA